MELSDKENKKIQMKKYTDKIFYAWVGMIVVWSVIILGSYALIRHIIWANELINTSL